MHCTASVPQPQVSKSNPLSAGPETCIDTMTREVTNLDLVLKIPKSSKAPIHLVQLLRFGERVVLVFFDTGANLHLINGVFAESLGIQVVSQKPKVFRVAGDDKVFTEYGLYRLGLGSTIRGKYHNILAHGLSLVTDKFPNFCLDKINEEVRASRMYAEPMSLPQYVGGSQVHLLVGIKNTAAKPRLVAHMGNGLSIYESPFPDIFDNRICYGGYHALFSAQTGVTNYASLYFLHTLRSIGTQLTAATGQVEYLLLEPSRDTILQAGLFISQLTPYIPYSPMYFTNTRRGVQTPLYEYLITFSKFFR